MKQPQYSPMKVSEMAVTLFTVNKGYYDDIDVKRALHFESALMAYLKQNQAAMLDKLEASKDLDADAEKALVAAIEAFKKTWA
jgi:F-type H+-transporting ATPase subunit alpha